MPRQIAVAAAQLGPIGRTEPRSDVVKRLIALMRSAKARSCDVVAFPELALTTFFPRWYLEQQAEIDSFYEREMPSSETRPLFETARELGIGFYLGYAELVQEDGRPRHFNTSILVDKTGSIVSKYRKIHVPGHSENEPERPFQHLEKRYFEKGNLGWPVVQAFGGQVGMCICNDRRWPETFRVMGLQGVEMVMVGYNTPRLNTVVPEQSHLSDFHSHLVMQAAAYQNSTWVVGVAKAGLEEGSDLIGGTAIIAPTGEIVAQCATLGDELAVAQCDFDLTVPLKRTIFNFARHREPEEYRLIVERKGARVNS